VPGWGAAGWQAECGGAVRVAGASLGTVKGMAVSAMVMSLDSSIQVVGAALRRENGPSAGWAVKRPPGHLTSMPSDMH
jgi:hypothetical protein